MRKSPSKVLKFEMLYKTLGLNTQIETIADDFIRFGESFLQFDAFTSVLKAKTTLCAVVVFESGMNSLLK